MNLTSLLFLALGLVVGAFLFNALSIHDVSRRTRNLRARVMKIERHLGIEPKAHRVHKVHRQPKSFEIVVGSTCKHCGKTITADDESRMLRLGEPHCTEQQDGVMFNEANA